MLPALTWCPIPVPYVYMYRGAAVTQPMLLLIVKGADSEAGRSSTALLPVPAAFLGIHYFLGKDTKPRVVEAHVALIEPTCRAPTASEVAAKAAAEAGEFEAASPDGWVHSTFAACVRRCLWHGLHTGRTELVNAERRACMWM